MTLAVQKLPKPKNEGNGFLKSTGIDPAQKLSLPQMRSEERSVPSFFLPSTFTQPRPILDGRGHCWSFFAGDRHSLEILEPSGPRGRSARPQTSTDQPRRGSPRPRMQCHFLSLGLHHWRA
jgi:hypothetical protein